MTMQNLMRVLSWTIVVASVIALAHTGTGVFRLDWILADIDPVEAVGTAGGDVRTRAEGGDDGIQGIRCEKEPQDAGSDAKDGKTLPSDSESRASRSGHSGNDAECRDQELVVKQDH